MCSFILKLLLPYGPMYMKRKKKNMAKIQNSKIHNSLNNFGRDPPYRGMHAFLE